MSGLPQDSPQAKVDDQVSAPALSSSDPSAPSSATCPQANQRTTGLRVFDAFLYPFLTNIGVTLISVAATYLTSRGGDRNAEGKLIFGKFGDFFHKRGEWMVEKFKGVGMNEGQAEMSKMVFFSYADGSLMAPVIKLFEDRREKIGRWLDKQFGTVPADESVYQSEPKQSWGSVLGGRFATCAIVVPTAVALEKAGLNDVLFSNPGKKMGEWVASKPNLAKHFGSLDVPELGKIGVFEAFYTSVCTAGLYISSRFLARQGEKKKHEKQVNPPMPAIPSEATANNFSLRQKEAPAQIPSQTADTPLSRIQSVPEGILSQRVTPATELRLSS